MGRYFGALEAIGICPLCEPDNISKNYNEYRNFFGLDKLLKIGTHFPAFPYGINNVVVWTTKQLGFNLQKTYENRRFFATLIIK